jgi:hypothetical protein
MKMRRRLLYETEPPVKGTNVAGVSNYQNPLMNLAINAGCFTQFGFVQTKNQAQDLKTKYPWTMGEAYWKKSDKPDVASNPYVYLIPNQDGESFRASYRDEQGVEKDSQETIYCQQLEETLNPNATKDQQFVINALKKAGFLEFQQAKPEDLPNLKLVDIAQDEDARKVLNDAALLKQFVSSGIRTFWMWKTPNMLSGLSQEVIRRGDRATKLTNFLRDKGWFGPNELPIDQMYKYEKVVMSDPKSYVGILDGSSDFAEDFSPGFVMYKPKGATSLSADAQKYLEYYTNTLGWTAKNDMTPAEIGAGEWEWVDLSKPGDYRGNLFRYNGYANLFPAGFMVGKKVNISMGDKGGGALNEESCRQIILNYYDEMMDETNGKTAPSLSDKRRVEACLTTFKGRYPKLKDKIQRLVTPPNTRASYGIKWGDYTTAPNLRTKLGMGKDVTIPTGEEKKEPTVQQESKDRLLKNIISENLVKLKKKQLLERTLSSKKTYRY